MIKKFKSFNPLMVHGKIILQYKVTNRFDRREIVGTEMSEGDTWGFFSFKQLTPNSVDGVN
jgi:hypothetical protein